MPEQLTRCSCGKQRRGTSGAVYELTRPGGTRVSAWFCPPCSLEVEALFPLPAIERLAAVPTPLHPSQVPPYRGPLRRRSTT